MEAEHCQRAGHDREFETLNYRIRSTPAREWRVVAEGRPAADTDMRCVEPPPPTRLSRCSVGQRRRGTWRQRAFRGGVLRRLLAGCALLLTMRIPMFASRRTRPLPPAAARPLCGFHLRPCADSSGPEGAAGTGGGSPSSTSLCACRWR
jgi:hypothetical protein